MYFTRAHIKKAACWLYLLWTATSCLLFLSLQALGAQHLPASACHMGRRQDKGAEAAAPADRGGVSEPPARRIPLPAHLRGCPQHPVPGQAKTLARRWQGRPRSGQYTCTRCARAAPHAPQRGRAGRRAGSASCKPTPHAPLEDARGGSAEPRPCRPTAPARGRALPPRFPPSPPVPRSRPACWWPSPGPPGTARPWGHRGAPAARAAAPPPWPRSAAPR